MASPNPGLFGFRFAAIAMSAAAVVMFIAGAVLIREE